MKKLLQTEQVAQLALSAIGMYLLPLHLQWWTYLLLFFAPDLSIIGYAVGNSFGALLYNLVHHKLVAAVLICTGLLLQVHAIVLAGLILWGHSSFDRIFGYGLKFTDSFKHTHLGQIGK